MTVTVQQPLLETLKKMDRPGMFCTSGRLPSTLPGVDVGGLGTVALPLEKRQATTLKNWHGRSIVSISITWRKSEN